MIEDDTLLEETAETTAVEQVITASTPSTHSTITQESPIDHVASFAFSPPMIASTPHTTSSVYEPVLNQTAEVTSPPNNMNHPESMMIPPKSFNQNENESISISQIAAKWKTNESRESENKRVLNEYTDQASPYLADKTQTAYHKTPIPSSVKALVSHISPHGAASPASGHSAISSKGFGLPQSHSHLAGAATTSNIAPSLAAPIFTPPQRYNSFLPGPEMFRYIPPPHAHTYDPPPHSVCPPENMVIISTLTSLLQEKDKQLTQKDKQLTEKAEHLQRLTAEITSLKDKLREAELAHNPASLAASPESIPVDTSSPTLPHLKIGSSIFRDQDEDSMINTKVISRSGAKPDDIKRILDAKLRDKEKFQSIEILVGGNKLPIQSPSNVVPAVVKDIEEVIITAKKLTECVSFVELPPRLTSEEMELAINELNEEVCKSCEQLGAQFISTRGYFYLQNGLPNEALISDDKIHLTLKGSQVLQACMNTNVREGHTTAVKERAAYKKVNRKYTVQPYMPHNHGHQRFDSNVRHGDNHQAKDKSRNHHHNNHHRTNNRNRHNPQISPQNNGYTNNRNRHNPQISPQNNEYRHNRRTSQQDSSHKGPAAPKMNSPSSYNQYSDRDNRGNQQNHPQPVIEMPSSYSPPQARMAPPQNGNPWSSAYAPLAAGNGITTRSQGPPRQHWQQQQQRNLPPWFKQQARPEAQLGTTCQLCGAVGHRAATCRSATSHCYGCGKTGHLKRCCPSAQ